MIGVGLMCFKTPVPSTMPATELLAGRLFDELLFKLLQFSLTTVICGGWAVVHFISMGTETGGEYVNIINAIRLDNARVTKCLIKYLHMGSSFFGKSNVCLVKLRVKN